MWMPNFREFQALMDLRRVVGHFGAPALEGIAAGDGAVLAELEPFGRRQDFEALSDRSRDALWTAALGLEDGRDAPLASVAVLLIDALESARSIRIFYGYERWVSLLFARFRSRFRCHCLPGFGIFTKAMRTGRFR